MKCFDRMRQSVPDLRCVVVGDGPLRARLEENYPQVIFAGMRTGEELAKYYASADVLLFPSETETFGNVLLEGMASGLVTLSYDYAAAARYVNDLNGLTAPKGDADAFIRKCQELIDRSRDGEMARAARETAETLGWDQVVADFEQRLGLISRSNKLASPLKRKNDKREKLSCRTLFLSDIHLGTPDCKAAEVLHFLKHIKCSKLVLNGDIIDGWALRRGGRWRGKHSRVIRKILKMMEKDHTEVIYLRGNHDDILERFLPLAFGRLKVGKEHIHVSPAGKRYLVVHGDGFDSVSTNHRWLAMMGAVGYDFLLKVNRFYNQWRAWRGKEYFSLSKSVKARVKSAVSFVDRYEELLQDLARLKNCEGIICGHIHTPEDKMTGDIHYLNSGDWVESLTAIIEHHDGRMELVRYDEFFGQKAEESETVVHEQLVAV